MKFALNHVTTARKGFLDFLDVAVAAGFEGVEERNDLGDAFFSGLDTAQAAREVQQRGLELHALAQLNRFDDWNNQKATDAHALIEVAAASGAQGICLIPCNDGTRSNRLRNKECLQLALRELKPLLESRGIIGLLEPLGFVTSTLRFKAHAVDAIDAVAGEHCFRLIHDTFHHHVSQDKEYFAELTAMVHVSGVNDRQLNPEQMTDADRVLIDAADQLGNIDQLDHLLNDHYVGPVSLEVFAPSVQALDDPTMPLRRSREFVGAALSV